MSIYDAVRKNYDSDMEFQSHYQLQDAPTVGLLNHVLLGRFD